VILAKLTNDSDDWPGTFERHVATMKLSKTSTAKRKLLCNSDSQMINIEKPKLELLQR
jgi:hypothetical protein